MHDATATLDHGIGETAGLLDSATEAAERARDWLLANQHADGYWVGELEGDSILQSEFLLLCWIVNAEDRPELPKIAAYLAQQQNEDGGWSMFPGGSTDISATVKGYFCLKLMGHDPEAPHMARARELIRSLGGAEKCNTFTRYYLACLGQISFDACPSVPPELVFAPTWFPVHMYMLSAWTRTMVLPLGMVELTRRVREIPAERGIAELYVDKAAGDRLSQRRITGPIPKDWAGFFLRVDRLQKLYNRSPIKPFRGLAMKKAMSWLLARCERSEGLGAIFPPMVYMLIVYKALGVADDDPRVRRSWKELEDFFIEENGTIRIQPCLSPVWDTGLTCHALAETGVGPGDEAAERATRWVLDKECRRPADWAVTVKGVEPSGWFFEFENPHYPDTDDSAMALVSMSRLGDPDACRDALARGTRWLLAMQNDDGGWAAFDKTKNRPFLEAVPFADHNATQDPSCPDITGRVMEGLAHGGLSVADAPIRRAVAYLKAEQDPCGGWWGRWGVNYVYGTWQTLCGLRAAGEDMQSDYTRRGAAWLESVQQADGSFGETPDSYKDASLKGTGESTASQTAWGAMGMMAVYGPDHPAVERAVAWLVERQNPDGSWDEPQFTGTGFPDVFYLRYHLYRQYFPTMAIGRYQRLLRERG